MMGGGSSTQVLATGWHQSPDGQVPSRSHVSPTGSQAWRAQSSWVVSPTVSPPPDDGPSGCPQPAVISTIHTVQPNRIRLTLIASTGSEDR